MKHFRKSGGFTLVELVVSIAVASLVTMAATTVLMLALRVNRQTSDTASQQNTVRALLTTMEKAATDGNITKVVSKLDSWQLIGVDISTGEDGEEIKTEKAVFSFDAFDRTISANGIVVLEDVYASNAILDGNLLSISIETKEGIFESTVYCRLGAPVEGESTEPTAPAEPETTRDKFLAILMSQLNSDGKINYDNLIGALSVPEAQYVPKSTETYYSQWYIGDAAFNDLTNNWNASTPWCACYISWALVEADLDHVRTVGTQQLHWYANVDDFMAHFDTLQTVPEVGNLVFFDWITDDGVQDPQHVGVVLQVDADCIITIEGNSAGRVAMRSYPVGDPRILGYGTLTWPKTEP